MSEINSQNKGSVRQSGLELLRILSMFMIVSSHMCGHGMRLDTWPAGLRRSLLYTFSGSRKSWSDDFLCYNGFF